MTECLLPQLEQWQQFGDAFLGVSDMRQREKFIPFSTNRFGIYNPSLY